ncbi:MAG: four helix bundle protein [Rubricoccaceae bacterium]|nr:four helix bundle protein [Rubricoccaceae bacterium]
MQDFKRLQVCQEAHGLTLAVYEATSSFPTDERFRLTSQLRRASVSIPSNLAEGSARGSDADFARSLQIATGSATEVEYQLLLAHDLGYLSPVLHAEWTERAVRVRRMLIALLETLRAQSA